jgi:hypothetical protein
MTNPMMRIHTTETGEIIDREMTNDEYALYLDSFKEPVLSEQEIAVQEAKSALLNKLGLTADEAKLLLS